MQGEEAGLPVPGSNSFREKPEETGPWTESGLASPFPGPYGKVSPSAVLGKSKYLVWPFQVRSSFLILAQYRSNPLISHDSPRTQAPPPAPRPAPKFEGCGWFVTHSPDFTPHRPGDVGFRLGIGPPKRGASLPEKAGDAPHRPVRVARGLRRERRPPRQKTWGPTKVSCVGACLFPLFATVSFSVNRG